MLQSCGRQEHRSSGEDDNDPLYSLYTMYQVIPILLLCVYVGRKSSLTYTAVLLLCLLEDICNEVFRHIWASAFSVK